MLLTIHNLPSSTRYADVKSLLLEKCGLTEIIVDNLVNEGKSKKVTVGLASEDDGAFVVRKLNGLFINGQQLYIEDRRRNTADQPYRPGSFEPSQPNLQPAMAPASTSWNQNAAAAYMQQMPIPQNLAFMGYGGVPQAMPYVHSQPVSADIPGYSGYQAETYAADKVPRQQESGGRDRNTRARTPDTHRHNNRKRRHSPDRSPPSKRSSRFDKFYDPKNDRESSKRSQWSEENRAFQADKFPRPNQNVEPPYQPRDPSPNYRRTNSPWNHSKSRWDKSPKRDQQWGDQNRSWEPESAGVYEQAQQWREEPRQWDNQQQPQWENQPQPQWGNQPQPQWGNQPQPWEVEPTSQWDNQTKPQWEARIPEENIRSDWNNHVPPRDLSRGNDREFQSRRNDSRPRNQVDQPLSDPIWTRESGNSFNSSRQPKPAIKPWEDRPRSIGRPDDRNNRPTLSRDRYGGPNKPNYEKPKAYPSREFSRQARSDAVPRHKTPRQENDNLHKPNAKQQGFPKEKKTYPPVSGGPFKKPFEAPKSHRFMINKDNTNRHQATNLISKTVMGAPTEMPYRPDSQLNAFLFKKVKVVVKARIDVIFGEELSVQMSEVVKRYREKFPKEDDKTLFEQIRETGTKEFEEKKESERNAEAQPNNGVVQVKKEPQNGQTKPVKQTTPVKKTAAPVLPKPPKNSKKPLTDKQYVKQMKELHKTEFQQDGLYQLDDVTTKALDEEVAELGKLFVEECSAPDGPEEAALCKHMATESLINFDKAIRVYISKRILNIATGLGVRLFSTGKLPRKEAIAQYLQKKGIQQKTLKKSTNGKMYLINLNRFSDFDKLCNVDSRVIDGIPVTFKPLHIVGPPPKISRDQVLSARQKFIRDQIQDFDLGGKDGETGDAEETWDTAETEDFGETDDVGENDNEETENDGEIEKVGETENDGEIEKIGETENDGEIEKVGETENDGEIEKVGETENDEEIKNVGETDDIVKTENAGDSEELQDFAEEINIDNINEEDLEDF